VSDVATVADGNEPPTVTLDVPTVGSVTLDDVEVVTDDEAGTGLIEGCGIGAPPLTVDDEHDAVRTAAIASALKPAPRKTAKDRIRKTLSFAALREKQVTS
jgi:hypothetical protein